MDYEKYRQANFSYIDLSGVRQEYMGRYYEYTGVIQVKPNIPDRIVIATRVEYLFMRWKDKPTPGLKYQKRDFEFLLNVIVLNNPTHINSFKEFIGNLSDFRDYITITGHNFLEAGDLTGPSGQ